MFFPVLAGMCRFLVRGTERKEREEVYIYLCVCVWRLLGVVVK